MPYIDVPTDISLHLQDWGKGAPTCVLLHGLGEGAYVWNPFAPPFGSTHRLLAPDFRGHGDSGWSKQRQYAVGDYVADILHVFQMLGIRDVTLVGHSLGAAVAVRLAVHPALRVRKLVLVDFGPGMNPEGRDHARQSLREQFRTYESIAEYADSLVDQRPMASREEIDRIARLSLREDADGGFHLKCDPAVADEPLIHIDDEQLTLNLAKIMCPTLVVRGMASAVLSAPAATRMMRFLRHGQLRQIEKAGHAVMVDNPAAFTTLVSGFLNH